MEQLKSVNKLKNFLDGPISQIAPDTSGMERLKSFITPTSITKEDVLKNPEQMNALRTMMAKSTDTIYANRPDPLKPDKTDFKTDEEVYDDFNSHMRWMNSNEVYTAKEAIDVFGSDDETKQAYGEAYKIYDQVGNVISSEGIGGLPQAIKDYGMATAIAPSTWVGFIVGKFFGKAGTEVAKEGIKEVTKEAVANVVKATTKELAAKGASKVVVQEAKREVVKASAKISAKKAAGIALAVEAPIASWQDGLYQNIMMDTGVQQDFSVAQNLFASGLGATSAVTSLLAHGPAKNATGLLDTGKLITVEKKARAAAAHATVAKEVKEAVVKANIDWINLAQKGLAFEDNPALKKEVFDWFTSTKREDGLIAILQRSGAELNVEDAGGFAKSLAEFADSMEPEARKAINEAFEPLGITFNQLIEISAASARTAGQTLNSLSSASKFLEDYKNITVTNREASQGVVAGMDNLVKDKVVDKQTLKYWQSVWKRALVSNIATSTANVKGWTILQAIKFPSQALQAASLYGLAGARKVLGQGADASATLGQANALIKNLGYMTRIAVDPFTTVEAFSELVNAAPKNVQKEISHHFFQGVEMKQGAAALGMNTEGFAVKNTEKLLTVAQRISFVHSQDVMTKAISGVSELDKQVRLAKNVGLDELIQSGRSHEITDEMWEKAIRVLQDDTFSTDFSKIKGNFQGLARISQNISQDKFGGFLWPFGQFVNSMAAFTWNHSPLGIYQPAMQIFKGKGTLDAGEKLSRAVVGSTLLGMAMIREGEKQKEGLQWNEERDSAGNVYKVDNLFPVSLTNLLGRIFHNARQGEGQDPDLWKSDLAKQLAIPAAIGEMESWKIVKEMGDYFSNGQADGSGNIVLELATLAANSLAGVASGVTRPLDTLNDVVGAAGDAQGWISNAAVDKKQAEGLEGVVLNLTRYTNNFFSLAFGEPDETGRRLFGKPKHSATQKGLVKPGNPGAALFGQQYSQARTPIDTLMGQVDQPPFKMDSFTSGDPEYDDFMNQVIEPILNREAQRLLNSDTFNTAPMLAKMKLIDQMLEASKQEVLSNLENGTVGGENDLLVYERRKLLVLSTTDVILAKRALGITMDNHKLNMTQIDMIKKQIEWSKEMTSDEFGY